MTRRYIGIAQTGEGGRQKGSSRHFFLLHSYKPFGIVCKSRDTRGGVCMCVRWNFWGYSLRLLSDSNRQLMVDAWEIRPRPTAPVVIQLISALGNSTTPSHTRKTKRVQNSKWQRAVIYVCVWHFRLMWLLFCYVTQKWRFVVNWVNEPGAAILSGSILLRPFVS